MLLPNFHGEVTKYRVVFIFGLNFQYVTQASFSTLVFTIDRPCQNWCPIQPEIVIILVLSVLSSPELNTSAHIVLIDSVVQKYKTKQILSIRGTSVVRLLMLISDIYKSL